MSNNGNVFSEGGGGTHFEQLVQTAFLTTMLVNGSAPCLPPNEIIELAFQTKNRGFATDDLLVLTKSAIGESQLLVQIKHSIVFSNNQLFNDVINRFWKDFISTKFNKDIDRLLLITNTLSKKDKNQIKTILSWAKTHSNENDFFSEINRIDIKKINLNILIEALEKANENSLTNKEVWAFLRNFEILEYDLGHEYSKDESYFFNLIRLSKGNHVSLNEKEIWDSIFAYTAMLNKNGGSISKASIGKEIIGGYFSIEKVSPYFKAVNKLQDDSITILNQFREDIHGYHLDRKELKESILSAMSTRPITIITGKPGVGKSAIVASIVKNEMMSSTSFCFRADQFNRPHLANVFSEQGINESIKDIFAAVSIIPEKVIVIDAMEKLLEGDPEWAFKQLLSVLKDLPSVRIICSARNYAISLLMQKFSISPENLTVIEIPPMVDSELSLVSEKFPQIGNILKNKAIKNLLQTPKYLDFAISLINKSPVGDYGNLTLSEFKNLLWKNIIENDTTQINGLGIKRRESFLEIAVKRAKKMVLFVEPDSNSTAEALEALLNDNVIFKDRTLDRYSPTHDILEDWALVKYVFTKYNDATDAKNFFESIGNEPAIRRAFRLWVEDYYFEKDDLRINDLVRDSLLNDSIEKYWADELLVAIFKSNNSALFFNSFKDELLGNKAKLLVRCIHLLCTACKEGELTKTQSYILIPTGSAWKEILLFVSKHISQLDTIRFAVIPLLSNWRFKQLHAGSTDEEELIAVKTILLTFINQIEAGDEFWQVRLMESNINMLVSILLNLVRLAKIEVTALIERTISKKDSHWKLDTLYDSILTNCLNGVNNQEVVKELPDLIIRLANKEWKINLEKTKKTGISALINSPALDGDECWGFNYKYDLFPAGIYKTPAFNLLQYNPTKGIDFIIDILNYSIDFYHNADCGYKHKFQEIEIEMPNGTKKKLLGAGELWLAYRGLSVTHHLLESLLMSLEKYLLFLASKGNKSSRDALNFFIDYIFNKTNNIAPISVIASVAMAYPREIEGGAFLIFSVKEFYEWDLTRSLQEHSALAPIDADTSVAQEERWKSNQLPHRKQYYGGLRNFVIDYQLKVGILNDKMHAAIDKLKIMIKEEDLIGQKMLTEIDSRKYELQPDGDSQTKFFIVPKYQKEVSELIEDSKESYSAQNEMMSYSNLLTNVYEGKENIQFTQWTECFNFYKANKESMAPYFVKNITLAHIGLERFENEMDEEQSVWCVTEILNYVNVFVDHAFNRRFGFDETISFLEKKVAINSFHLLFKICDNIEDKKKILGILTYLYLALMSKSDTEDIEAYVTNTLWKINPKETEALWNTLIKYSLFRKQNPYYYDDFSENRQKTMEKENEYIISIIDSEEKADIHSINFSDYEKWILDEVALITPFSTTQPFQLFIKKYIELTLEELEEENDTNFRFHGRGRLFNVEKHLAALLIQSENKFSNEIIDLLLNKFYSIENDKTEAKRTLLEFISDILKNIVYNVDELIANQNDDGFKSKIIESFWQIWSHLNDKIKLSGKGYFVSILLLNTGWKLESKNWKPLEANKKFYIQLINEYGTTRCQEIINVFSTIGEKSFLPEGLNELVNILKKSLEDLPSLTSSSAEQLINRLFYNHISAIKRDKTLIANFIWLLDRMISLGSSPAYMFREDVITYKVYEHQSSSKSVLN